MSTTERRATGRASRCGHTAACRRGTAARPGPASAAVRGLAAALLALAVAACEPAPPAPVAASFAPDSVPDAFAEPAAALAWPGTTRAVLVDATGGLDDGAVTLAFAAQGNGADAPAPGRIAFEDRWRPVAHWRRTAGPVRFDFEAVLLPAGSRDTTAFASVLVTVTNTGAAPAQARLAATLAYPEERPAFVVFDRGPADAQPVFAGGGGDRARAWASGRVDGARAAWEWSLAPGAAVAARVVLGTYTVRSPVLKGFARRPHDACVRESRRHWEGEIARAARFELGDPEVERALRAAWVVLLACRERTGEDAVPIGGPFHYRDVWLRDGARAVSALAVSGYTGEAGQLARGLARLQWDDGAFVSQRGQLDGLGQAPWAFAQAVLRASPDTAGVARLAESAARAWRYRQWMRAFAAQAGWPLAHFLPPADPRDCELAQAQLVGNDAWAIAGSTATVRLLRAAGREALADSVQATLARDAAEFREALARTGRPDVPPSWQLLGRDWGNLAVGWPCRALPADDPHLAALARRVWDEGGGTGLVAYGNPDSLHGYVGADLGTWALLAGRRADAGRVLDALLHWRNASGGGAEVIERSAHRFSNNLPPHPTTAAALVALVRNSLVYDDDDTLRLALGARGRWWRGGRVSAAPTRWGRVDVALEAGEGFAECRWSAVPAWTEVALPPGTRLGGPAPAPLVAAREGRAVLAPPGTTRARVTLVREEDE